MQQHQNPLAIATVDAQCQLHFLKQQYGHTDTILLVVSRVSDPNASLRMAPFHPPKPILMLRILGRPSTSLEEVLDALPLTSCSDAAAHLAMDEQSAHSFIHPHIYPPTYHYLSIHLLRHLLVPLSTIYSSIYLLTLVLIHFPTSYPFIYLPFHHLSIHLPTHSPSSTSFFLSINIYECLQQGRH